MSTTQINGTQIKNNGVTKDQVDSSIIVAAGTNAFSADQSHGGFKITNLGTCTADADAAPKSYVDSHSPTGTTLASGKIWVGNGSNVATAYLYIIRETPSGTLNGSNTNFTLANTPLAGTECVYLNGILQDISNDYTISSTTITFVVAPQSSDRIRVNYIGS
jgi:hypothetical protein